MQKILISKMSFVEFFAKILIFDYFPRLRLNIIWNKKFQRRPWWMESWFSFCGAANNRVNARVRQHYVTAHWTRSSVVWAWVRYSHHRVECVCISVSVSVYACDFYVLLFFNYKETDKEELKQPHNRLIMNTNKWDRMIIHNVSIYTHRVSALILFTFLRNITMLYIECCVSNALSFNGSH